MYDAGPIQYVCSKKLIRNDITLQNGPEIFAHTMFLLSKSVPEFWSRRGQVFVFCVFPLRGVAKGGPGGSGTPESNSTKIIMDNTCTHQACTAHQADRTMNVLNELRSINCYGLVGYFWATARTIVQKSHAAMTSFIQSATDCDQGSQLSRISWDFPYFGACVPSPGLCLPGTQNVRCDTNSH